MVEFVAQGDHSETVRATLQDLEAQAKMERAAIEALKDRLRGPVSLPRPHDVLARATELDQVLQSDPHRARERLRRVLVDGRIVMTPLDDGAYEARATFLPLLAYVDSNRDDRAARRVVDALPHADVRMDLVARVAPLGRGRRC